MAVRGKGRDEFLCRAMNEPDEKIVYSKKAGCNPQYGFVYEGYVEYGNERAFLRDVEESLECQMLVEVRGGYTPMKSSTWSDAIKSTLGKLPAKDFCDLCGADDRLCEIAPSFQAVREMHFRLKQIQECPNCGAKLGASSGIPERNLYLHDVRLDGHPAVLEVTSQKEWRCNKCGARISSVRIPILQAKKRGKFTLRLLQSILEKKVEGRPASEIAEAYGIRLNTVNVLVKDYKRHLKDYYEHQLKTSVSRKEYLHKEKFYLKGKEFWAVIDLRENVLLAILSKGNICQVDALLSGAPISKYIDCSMALACTFAPLGERRHHLIVNLLDLMQKAIVNGLDALSGEIRALTEKVIFSDELTARYLRVWLTENNNENMRENTAIEQVLRQELKDIVEDDLHKKEYGYGEAYFINNNMYRNTEKKLEHFMWSREEPWRQNNYLLYQLEWKSMVSGLRVAEQIERILWFNELSLYSFWNDGIEMGVDGLPAQDSLYRLGQGIPLKCLFYLSMSGLLDEGAHSIRCVKHRMHRSQQDREGCSCAVCPVIDGSYEW